MLSDSDTDNLTISDGNAFSLFALRFLLPEWNRCSYVLWDVRRNLHSVQSRLLSYYICVGFNDY